LKKNTSLAVGLNKTVKLARVNGNFITRREKMSRNQTCSSAPAVTLSVAVEQFIEAKTAQRLSNNTLIDYKRTLRYFREFFGDEDPLFSEITPHQVRKFLNSLDRLSKKTLLNCHIGLSSLWHWATDEGLCTENTMHKVARPRPEIRAIQPLTHEEVDKLFNAMCSMEYTVPGKRSCSSPLPYLRTRAMMLIMFDNGIRELELCHIRAKDLSPTTIKVFGKGDKERLLPISEVTYEAIQDYFREERPGGPPKNSEDYVFITKTERSLTGDGLYHIIARVGARAGVKAYPHKFRHTFAINFLINGGNVFALQAILGHASLEMGKRYLAIAMADIQTVHRNASVVNCWQLGTIGIGIPVSLD
jgi:integrase/recombinase XerD